MENPNTPQPSIGVILAEIGGALLGALLLMVVFYFAVVLLLINTPWGQQLGMGLLVLQTFAALFGFGIGAGLGVALAGRLLGRPGSIGLAIAGAILSGFIALGMYLLNFTPPSWYLGIGAVVAVAFAGLGAALAGRLLGRPGSTGLAIAGLILSGFTALGLSLLNLAGLFWSPPGIAAVVAVALAVLGYNLRR